ncbi:uncharacterized protein UV8b_02274 [Ustilaginoidea virens]|uniref:Autophagy-related protein 29 n=1 Tax=Ustilaginoidea virens TaxID=1159556 RepID=A0A8E5MF54_USTVR|nr:uncharacterized protein UV8b_02274 [Ustilaginoidea virens]QUC18033.1 hypothetical protein UV8b_02274 [Ustilaginoidea virens]
MSQPNYTVYVRVPIPRGDFVDPPPVHWDSTKDDALWRILSGAAQTEIDWNQVAETFDVPVDFLLQQVAFLTERHASQVRAQVRKATAAAKGSAAPSPVPGAEPSSSSHPRTTSALSARRDPQMPRPEMNASGTSASMPVRPSASRDASANNTTIILKDASGSSPRHGPSLPASRAADPGGSRKRLASLPATLPSPRPAELQDDEPRDDGTASPGPAESSSNESSSNESSPAQSRIIRRPPRFQPQDAAEAYPDDEDDESEPAFQPYQTGQDLASTLKGDGKASVRHAHKSSARDVIHQSQTSDDSSTGSPVAVPKPKFRKSNLAGPLSPKRTAELSGRSPTGKGKASSRDGSDGTLSMGSSFSDLDDASVTQSALEEALASHMNRPGASSRFSISQAFRSRYKPGAN